MKVAAISGSSGLTLNQMLIKLDDNATADVAALKGDAASAYDTLGKIEDVIIANDAAVVARLNVIEGSGNGSITKAVADLVDSAPGALNTLNELAAAINDDAGFHTTITNMVGANETHVDNMATLTGMAKDSTHLGAFSGAVIADNQTVKAALQALETKVEAVQTDVDGNESDADAAIAANEVHIDNFATLSGVAKDAVNLGTFTGQSIQDNRVVKVALQDLETAIEANETEENGRLDKAGGFHVENSAGVYKLGWGSGKPRVSFSISGSDVTMSVDVE